MKLEEKQTSATAAARSGTAAVTGAARAVAADELDPGRERRPLES